MMKGVQQCLAPCGFPIQNGYTPPAFLTPKFQLWVDQCLRDKLEFTYVLRIHACLVGR